MYTKGEWKAIYTDNEGLVILAGKVKVAKPLYFQGVKSNEEFQANARLIAQAPRMYEQLEKLIARIDGGSALGEKLDIEPARQIIAKVKGE